MRKPASALALVILVGAYQQPTAAHQLQLRPAVSVADHEFGNIISIREVASGQALISDGRHEKVLLLDAAGRGVSEPIRQGKGPQEYERPGEFFSLGNDSSLMADVSQRRWLLFLHGKAVATVALDQPGVRVASSLHLGYLHGADSLGHVMVVASPPLKGGIQTDDATDSNLVVLVRRTTGRADTIAKVRRAPLVRRVQKAADGEITGVRSERPPWSVGETATLFTDGWLAVVRLDPYRVDWRDPSGRWIRGQPLPVASVRVNAAEKAYYMQRIAPAGKPPASPGTIPTWPAEVPPLRSVWSSIAAADGRLLIPRNLTSANRTQRYDIVNRQGRLDGTLSIPDGAGLLAVSRRFAYVTQPDRDDIPRLSRHPWP